MPKLTSREISQILQKFAGANADTQAVKISNLKYSHPKPINTLLSFETSGNLYGILYDETADEDETYLLEQFASVANGREVRLLHPIDDPQNYSLRFRGKTVYVFVTGAQRQRLDVFLANRHPEFSRNLWQKMISRGSVMVNDRPGTADMNVSASDAITYSLPADPDFSERTFPIIYLDDDVIVIDKPSGVLTHSKGSFNDEFTVADFFARFGNFKITTNRNGIVHRLDRDTSGVLIGGRSDDSVRFLQRQFALRKVRKTYLAVVHGLPKEPAALIDLPILRNPAKPSRFKVDIKGRPARTTYQIMATTSDLSLLKLQPETGRTHQLRVHLGYIGHPILGDKVYGKADAERLMLHAASLEITLPNGQRQTFVSPVPEPINSLFPGFHYENVF